MTVRVLLFTLCFSALKMELVQFPALLIIHDGENAILNCYAIKSGTSSNEATWFVEKHNSCFQIVTAGGRFHTETNNSTLNSSLVINGVKKEDSGRYYCARCTVVSAMFGNGSNLIVRAREPFITVFIGKLQSSSTVKLVCLVCDLPSDEVSVSWTSAGKIIRLLTSVKNDSCQTFGTCKYIKAVTESHNDVVAYTCTVEFENGKNFNKSVTIKRECPGHWLSFILTCVLRPIVFLLILVVIGGIYCKKKHENSTSSSRNVSF
ncbi:immunoglobulin alpha-2 heavy chain-like [Protopterus annectens]|uniref:immunoglobulin alpha-2 heavy chain-like n=1 Tax=Protopterus annectens TaxID=7888 RepID=UPI001CF95531|nr:immunoglobulin alpha-2 heavy chain-like [Protopterus annectens]